jgi:hypothetical protein
MPFIPATQWPKRPAEPKTPKNCSIISKGFYFKQLTQPYFYKKVISDNKLANSEHNFM